MSHLHLDETGFTEIDEDGAITRPTPVPFQVWTLIGGWRPICNEHKMLFVSRRRYYEEHSYCDKEWQAYPDKDWYWIKVPSYKRVWL